MKKVDYRLHIIIFLLLAYFGYVISSSFLSEFISGLIFMIFSIPGGLFAYFHIKQVRITAQGLTQETPSIQAIKYSVSASARVVIALLAIGTLWWVPVALVGGSLPGMTGSKLLTMSFGILVFIPVVLLIDYLARKIS